MVSWKRKLYWARRVVDQRRGKLGVSQVARRWMCGYDASCARREGVGARRRGGASRELMKM